MSKALRPTSFFMLSNNPYYAGKGKIYLFKNAIANAITLGNKTCIIIYPDFAGFMRSFVTFVQSNAKC